MITQSAVALHAGLDVSSVNKILHRTRGPVFRPETIEKVFRIAHELGYDFSRLKYPHRRRQPRRSLRIPAGIDLYSRDGKILDRGMGVISDLSLSGAGLSSLTLSKAAWPLDAHTLALRSEVPGLEDIAVLGHVVRLETRETPRFGVSFLHYPEEVARALKRLMHRRTPALKLV